MRRPAKRGGTLTYMIPADAPPSFDGHREGTFATLHAVAPFYSVLIRINPENPSSTTDFVCDLCTAMPQPTDGGKTYTFKIRDGVKFADGSQLTAADVVASWNEIIDPPEGRLEPARRAGTTWSTGSTRPTRRPWCSVSSSLPALFCRRSPTPSPLSIKRKSSTRIRAGTKRTSWVRARSNLSNTKIGQSIKGVRNPDYYHKGLPYLDGFTGIFADKQAVRVDAIRSDRAAIEFRGFPPSARDELSSALGDKLAVQESDWNCGSLVTPNDKKKPFDDLRVRRALTLAIDRWHGAPALSRIANVHTVGGIVFPGSPLAATKEELEQIAGFWPDIDKSRAEAKRLLKEAGAEGLSFELLNRNVDQPYKYVATWLVDEWSKIGLHVTQRVRRRARLDAMRSGNFDVVLQANCHGVPNPLLDVQSFLPSSVYAANYGNYEDPQEVATLQQDAAGNRRRQAALIDARVREIRHRYRGPSRSGSSGGTGSSRTGPMSKAGRSARAISSTRIWRQSGWINKQDL